MTKQDSSKAHTLPFLGKSPSVLTFHKKIVFPQFVEYTYSQRENEEVLIMFAQINIQAVVSAHHHGSSRV